MNSIDCIQNFASNMRTEQFLLSSAQVMLAIINKNHRHKTIQKATQLHPNTVSSIIKALIEQGYVNKYGDSRPFVYRASTKGEHLAYRLLKHPEKKNSNYDE